MQEIKKTASGHNAGIQSIDVFAENERFLKATRDKMLHEVNLHGIQEDTVYRDKSGKKMDVMNEFIRKQSVEQAKNYSIENAQYEWGKGSIQKQDKINAQNEMIELKNEPFARSVDNVKIDEERRRIIRDGDPMAAYVLQNKRRHSTDIPSIQSQDNKKPKYAGPIPTPNRFGILPGYRWDAINRSNNFEHGLLTRISDKRSLREDEYKWSVSDL